MLLLVSATVGGWAAARSGCTSSVAPSVPASSPARVAALLAAPGARATVERVVDGDTVVVRFDDGGRRRRADVRYLGVDAPESVHPRQPVGCFGPAAARVNRAWVAGRRVRLRFDRERIDHYGRLLAALTPEGWRRSVSERLVAEGYARVLTIAPNGATAARLQRLQQGARRARRGLWRACRDALRSGS